MDYFRFAAENALIQGAVDEVLTKHGIGWRVLPQCKVCRIDMRLIGDMTAGTLYQCPSCKTIEVL